MLECVPLWIRVICKYHLGISGIARLATCINISRWADKYYSVDWGNPFATRNPHWMQTHTHPHTVLYKPILNEVSVASSGGGGVCLLNSLPVVRVQTSFPSILLFEFTIFYVVILFCAPFYTHAYVSLLFLIRFFISIYSYILWLERKSVCI